jgi:hypothetical protein
MSVSASLGKLREARKDLRVRWAEVTESWRDENSRRFEERYLTPLTARIRQVELAMGHMAAILQKARHDCE